MDSNKIVENSDIQLIGVVNSLAEAWQLDGCNSGACVWCKEDKHIYICDGTSWQTLGGGDPNTGMSLYSLNQSFISKLPVLSDNGISKLQLAIQTMASKDKNDFHMLLCNELHYYTVLWDSGEVTADFINIGQAVTDLLYESDWEIICYDEYDDRIEIWSRKDMDTHVFMFFPYDKGVVTHGQTIRWG